MKKSTILKELSNYLNNIDVDRLGLVTALQGSVVMCLAISDIVRSYNGTTDQQARVSFLLSNLCKIHFKTPAA